MRRSIWLLLVTALWSGLAADPAVGQFRQYTQPGVLGITGTGIDRELLEVAVSEARWRLGPVRIDPWVEVRDASWYEGAGDEEGDFTTTAGAGLRAYLRSGPDLYWTAHVLPEYVWWLERDERRRLNGRYGAAVLAYFNRLETSVRVVRSAQQSVVSVELPERIDLEEERAAAAASLALGRTLSLFGEASFGRVEFIADDRTAGTPLELLDREEQAVRAGIRYRPRPSLDLAIGVETTRTDSLDPRRDLSNEGTSPFAEAVLESRRLRLELAAGLLSLDPQPGSAFVPFDDFTAETALTLKGNRLSPAVYGRRSLAPAISAGYPYYVSEIAGAALDLRLGSRTNLRGFGELGEARFERSDPAVAPRTDDLAAYGLVLSLQLGRSLSLTGGYDESRFESGGETRTIRQLRVGLTFGGSRSPWY